MSWPLDVLGLPLDADATTIKRAYARLLRDARPDEDAEAFQRLNEAYRAALAQVEQRAAQRPVTPAVMTTAAAPTPPASEVATPAAPDAPNQAATSPPPRQILVDPSAVAAQCIRIAIDAKQTYQVPRQLQAIDPLWSLQIKQHVAQHLLQQLFRQPQAMPAERFDVLLEYFDLHVVDARVDPAALARLRHHQQLLHDMQPEHQVDIARRAQVMKGQLPDLKRLRSGLALLAKPLRWDRVALASWQRGYAPQLARIAHVLGGAQGGFGLNREQSDFWLQAAAPGMSAARYWLGFCRSLSIAAGLALLLGWLAALDPGFPFGFDQPAWARVLIAACSSFIAMIGLWTLIAGYIVLERWQSQPDTATRKHFWLRRLWLPTVASIGACLSALPAARIGADALLWLLLCITLRSQLRLNHKPVRPNGFAVLWIAGLVARIDYYQFDQDWQWSPLGLSFAAALWLLWGWRMWQFRALLHKSNAA